MIRKHPLFLFPFFEKKGEEKTFLSDETAPPVQQKYVDYFSTRLSLPSRGREKEERTIFPSFLFPSPGFSSFPFFESCSLFHSKAEDSTMRRGKEEPFFSFKMSSRLYGCQEARLLLFLSNFLFPSFPTLFKFKSRHTLSHSAFALFSVPSTFFEGILLFSLTRRAR